ncbi:MAG: hypothetical protein A3H96_19445 [Acidobacteria bacterium RIFCSPLOWO2_02_FULL_67_36]|nr:MAG: hypothetical protein A3H96_19445 [Acidobacteria bacterium RIFCSPLOWO2_02_FULL_67_36]OFW25296.1 MAG: hypothetical protein A3G21_19970 [Acidobacteria bacterium RIFCSPLOWO2_12_FULL_66_21]
MFRFLLNSAASPDAAIAEELFDSLPLGVALQDADGRILAVNPAAVHILGVPREDLVGRLTYDPSWHAQRADGSPCPDEEHSALVALRTGKPVTGFILGVHSKADEQRWLRVTSVPVFSGRNDPAGVYSFFEDVTEGRLAERALASRIRQQQVVVELQRLALTGASQAALSTRACELCAEVLHAETAGVLVLEPDGLLHFEAGCGWSSEERSTTVPSGKEDSQSGYTLYTNDVVVADFATETRFRVHPLLKDRVRSGITAPIPGLSGPYGILGIHSAASLHFNDDDVDFMRAVAGVLGASVRQAAADAERRGTAAQLEAAHALTTAIIESSGDAVFVNDVDGRYRFLNSAAAAQIGAPIEEAVGRTAAELMPPAVADELNTVHREVVNTGERVVRQEEGWGAAGGRQFVVTRAPHHDAKGRLAGVISFARDVTEQRRLAEHLRQTQKLESIGRLAGGIAHDFNNLMTIVLGYADALESGGGPEGSAPGYITEIKRAAERAALLTRQLLAFSRQQTLRPKVLDPNWVIANMDRMLRRVIGEDIELLTRLSPEAGHVRVDPSQLEQVLLNVVINARHAMPDGGSLSIETANVELTADLLKHQPDARAGRYVLVSISDTGCGMDRETLARAFEPFFTTKGSAGTGLGLATVYGIVKQSGGEVWAYSEPGCGTSINVYLPRVDLPADTPAADSPVRPSGAERILLVEDEAPVRQLLARTLKRFGYDVTEAEDGREALAILEDRKGAFALLITDAVMPYIGGRELSERVTRTWPDIRILVISGYAGGQESDADGAISFLFLQKPFTAAALAAKVREALDSPRASGS